LYNQCINIAIKGKTDYPEEDDELEHVEVGDLLEIVFLPILFQILNLRLILLTFHS